MKFNYPNDIGPGVYDIHSPRVPTAGEIERLLRKALKVIPKERLWVNPDCGLKTRGWTETIEQLKSDGGCNEKITCGISVSHNTESIIFKHNIIKAESDWVRFFICTSSLFLVEYKQSSP